MCNIKYINIWVKNSNAPVSIIIFIQNVFTHSKDITIMSIILHPDFPSFYFFPFTNVNVDHWGKYSSPQSCQMILIFYHSFFNLMKYRHTRTHTHTNRETETEGERERQCVCVYLLFVYLLFFLIFIIIHVLSYHFISCLSLINEENNFSRDFRFNKIQISNRIE